MLTLWRLAILGVKVGENLFAFTFGNFLRISSTLDNFDGAWDVGENGSGDEAELTGLLVWLNDFSIFASVFFAMSSRK